MSEPETKPIWPWIVPPLIGLPVLYVLSLGPWNWLVAHGWISQQTVLLLGWIYLPIDWISRHGPEPVWQVISWYIGLWQ